MQATAFTIEQLEGPNSNRAKVVLARRALPHRPFELTGKLRAEVTWYPGNPVGTGQVFGTEEAPTTINGEWHDKHIKQVSASVEPDGIAEVNGQQVADVLDLVNKVDIIRKQGLLVRVTWDAIIRDGYLTEFPVKWHRREDVEWSMQFTWVSQGQPVKAAAFAGKNEVSDTRDDFFAQMRQLASQARQVVNAAKEWQTRVFSLINQVADGVSSLGDTASQAVQLIIDGPTALQRTAAAAGGIANYAGMLASALEASPVAAQANGGRQQVPTTQPTQVQIGAGQRVAVAAYNRQLGRSSKKMVRTAAARQATLAQRTSPDLLTIVQARQGEDLRATSIRAYGTANHWRDLQQFNRLPTSVLAAGQVVLVPRLQGAAQP